jgi:general secretion pathway protein A
MYEAFFGFTERPFELTPNPRFLVATRSHGEALANLEYGIASRKGITLLVGDAGTGKTTLIRSALERQSARTHCVYLHNPALTREEFVEMLALRFELSEEARTSKTACLVELEALLRRRHEQPSPETTVLVVDEAQSLPFDLLEEIRLLANIETDEHKLLSVIIAGQPEIAARLNEQSLRQLKQRIALRCLLQPLTAQETAVYLAGRIQAAGGRGGQVLTKDAVEAIHAHSRGIPRAINVVTDNALLTAFALQQRLVTRQIVLDVCKDFDLGVSVDASAAAPAETKPQAAPAAAAAAAAPAAQAAPVKKAAAPASGRILKLEPAGTPETADEPPRPTATATTERPEADTRGSLFNAFVKRRRFSFF